MLIMCNKCVNKKHFVKKINMFQIVSYILSKIKQCVETTHTKNNK